MHLVRIILLPVPFVTRNTQAFSLIIIKIIIILLVLLAYCSYC